MAATRGPASKRCRAETSKTAPKKGIKTNPVLGLRNGAMKNIRRIGVLIRVRGTEKPMSLIARSKHDREGRSIGLDTGFGCRPCAFSLESVGLSI
jgi:hypothetical protein